MYIKSVSAYNFRCFGEVELHLQYPGKITRRPLGIPNVSLLLGSNGSGKSSVLRALAIAALAPILKESGFVPYRMVRRPGADPNSLLKVRAILDPLEAAGQGRQEVQLVAHLLRRSTSNQDSLLEKGTPKSPLMRYIYDEKSPVFFVAGYGATRRTEMDDFSLGSARKSRGQRYQRVASLFEDHVALRPLQSWLPKASAKRQKEVVQIFNDLLPQDVRFRGKLDVIDDQYVFLFQGRPTPFPALSDGYRAFIGWLGDLACQMVECCPKRMRLSQLPGLVLIDEIDLHLHPEWQRTVVPNIANGLPRLQFVLTSHSPIVVGTLQHENIFVAEVGPKKDVVVKRYEESVHGKSAEQLLLSSYFGMQSTRAEDFTNKAEDLFARAAKGDADAAIEYLNRLSGKMHNPTSEKARTSKTMRKKASTQRGPKL